MEQIFGNFIESGEGHEYMIIHFSPTSIPLQQRWRNNGLSADFLAEYWATFFPAGDQLSHNRRLEIKAAISYISNELLENVMKFSYKPAHYSVDLKLYLFADEFRFYTRNAIDPQTVPVLQSLLQTLLTGDPQALFLQQIERNAQGDSAGVSHLGLLTMINDYEAGLAWRFEHDTAHPDQVVLTSMVRLGLQ